MVIITDNELIDEYYKYEQLIHFVLYKKLHIWNSETYKFGIFEYDDLFSEGKIGLLNAIKTYDKSKNIKKTTYYTKVIFNRIAGRIYQMSYYHVRSANMNTCSLDSKVYKHDDENETKFIDELSYDFDYYKNLINDLAKQEALDKANLSNKEKFVLNKVQEGYTQVEIGKLIGSSSANVHNILNNIFKRIGSKKDYRLHINSQIADDYKPIYKTKPLVKYWLYDDGKKEVLLHKSFKYINEVIFSNVKPRTLRSYIYKKVKINNRYYIFKSKEELDEHIAKGVKK